MPSGTIELCGRMPIFLATCLVGWSWMSRPSRITRPAVGFRSRASAFSSVDLPQPFGPTTAVNSASRIARSRQLEMMRLP